MVNIIPPEKTPKYNKILGTHETKKSWIKLSCANENCNNVCYKHWSLIDKYSVFSCSWKCKKSQCVKCKLATIATQKGNINPFKTKEGQEKAKKTIQEKYGVDNVFKSDIIKHKIKTTMVEKYGEDSPMKVPEIRQKAMITRLVKYGEENLTGVCPTIKTKQTNLDKYGNEWFFGSVQGYMSKQNLIENYNYSEEEVEEMFKRKGITIKNLTRKYGDKQIATEMYEKWKMACANTLENFIKRHGVLDGRAKYDEYNKKRQLQLKQPFSKISKECFNEICYNLTETNQQKCFYGKNEHVICVQDINKDLQVFFVDFKLDNKIIEFYGDFWHGNPDVFDGKEIHPIIQIPYFEITKKDEIRINLIKSLGYDIFIIWEQKYRNNKEQVIEEAIKFLTT